MSARSVPRRPLRQLAASALALGMVAAIGAPASGHAPADYESRRAHLVGRAKEQRGAPYTYGGSSPRGFDCSGLTRWVFGDHGAKLPHSSMGQFNLGNRPGFRRIHKRRNLEPGDLVFHKTTSARVGHVGIYIGGGNFISSTSSGGVRTRSVYDPYYWGARWVAATRVPATRRF